MSKSKGFLSQLFCCFGDDNDEGKQVTGQGEIKLVLKNADKSKLPTVESDKFLVTTKNEPVIASVSISEETKFCCGICLKYFNVLLKSSCCKNQVCNVCLSGIFELDKKYERKSRCPFCMAHKGEFKDINREEKVVK